jgi:hypothetical protein
MSNSVFGLRLGDSEHEFLEKAADGTDGILSKAGVVRVLIRQAMDSQWEPLTSQNSVPTVPAYCVGAGNTFPVHQKPPLQFPPDLEVTNPEPPTEAVTAVKPKSWKPKSVNARLKNFEPLIMEFWRVKKGSKGETAWKRLQGQLEKFLDTYGDTVVNDQLELAINGKWAGIEFSRYEQFKPAKKPWQQEPEMKHPAHRDFTAERIAAERESESTENFLNF